MKYLYLIRHGLTAANEQHLYCGSTDLSLSGTGIDMLRKESTADLPDGICMTPEGHPVIGSRTSGKTTAGADTDFSGMRFAVSGLKRTVETLHILFGHVMYETIPELREMDFGIFEMKSYEQLREDPEYQRWITGDNESNIAPGGDSGLLMKRRALAALNWLREEDDRDVVVITHGGVIAAIMEELYPQYGRNRYQWQPEPGHGYRLPDQPIIRPECSREPGNRGRTK